MHIDQANRWLTLDSPLGHDVLVPIEATAWEAVSAPFRVEIECVSPREVIAPDAILGQPHALAIGHDHQQTHFHGIVKSLSPGPNWARDLRIFRIELVPRLWLLTQTQDLRIFQEQAAPAIIDQILGEHEITDVDTSGLHETYPQRTYCVQYRETDFAFLSRLMEEEGIFYHFDHTPERHILKLADGVSGYTRCRETEIPLRQAEQVAGTIVDWRPRFAFRSGHWTLRDYDFERPETDLTARQKTRLSPGAFTHEVYDYPGRYTQKERGEHFAQARMDAHDAGHDLVEGAAYLPVMRAGTTFTLTDHPSPDQDGRTVLLREARHEASDHSHVSGGGGGGSSYSNSFLAMPAERVFRPEATTPKPVVHGPQTAVVTGPSGEDIHCDEHGRIKVQFHWDREGERDAGSSCWLRVAQSMAGRGWGALFTPRVGMEVVVAFLEGDPDRPLVVGTVYNGKNPPPYDLPGNKTQSGFKSRSSPEGGRGDFNELRFEDKAGAEQVYLHAQRDCDTVVERDQTVTVETGDRTIGVESGSEYTEAQQAIEMRVGNNSIVIDQGGITLKGIKIKIEGSASLRASAPSTSVTGGGTLTLKGGLVRIN